MGNAENDTYLFAAGDGKDTINNYRIDVTSIGIIQFIDASFENLWFSRSSNNLQINLAGTDDQLTITNWYSSYIYQLNQIHAGTSVLSSDKVDQLVSAISLYQIPSGEGNIISKNVMDVLQPIFTELWL